MPIKITYDLNNEQECNLIDDYYFFKSYLKSLIFDWEKFYYTKDYKPSIIEAHLNITEFNRFKELYLMILTYYYEYQITADNMDIFLFQDIFYRGKNSILQIYKSYIKYKLQKQNNL